ALARAERNVVDLAAVIGREFTAAELVLLELSARADGEHASGPVTVGHRAQDLRRVEEALTVLGRRRLVESAPPATDLTTYRFSSGLVHEVTYASLSKRAKADRHAWAAELPSV